MKSAPYSRWFVVLLLGSSLSWAQSVTLTAHVATENEGGGTSSRGAGNVVIWLTPIGNSENGALPQANGSRHLRLVQKNKGFQPHVLVVPVGSLVQFPNHDPFFHNVFSLFEGKRFDLGLYEAGSSRDVLFDKAGISYIFCNIHPEMSAVVIALNTPFYAISDRRGEIVIPNVPAGRYTLNIWYEAALPEALKEMSREITVSANRSSLGVLRLVASNVSPTHKNKYGRDYDPPTPDSPVYQHP